MTDGFFEVDCLWRGNWASRWWWDCVSWRHKPRTRRSRNVPQPQWSGHGLLKLGDRTVKDWLHQVSAFFFDKLASTPCWVFLFTQFKRMAYLSILHNHGERWKTQRHELNVYHVTAIATTTVGVPQACSQCEHATFSSDRRLLTDW